MREEETTRLHISRGVFVLINFCECFKGIEHSYYYTSRHVYVGIGSTYVHGRRKGIGEIRKIGWPFISSLTMHTFQNWIQLDIFCVREALLCPQNFKMYIVISYLSIVWFLETKLLLLFLQIDTTAVIHGHANKVYLLWGHYGNRIAHCTMHLRYLRVVVKQ